MADSTKQRQLDRRGDAILQTLNTILNREIMAPKDVIISLTRVKLDGDMSKIIVYYTFFPDYKMGTVKRFFKEKRKSLQHFLQQKINFARVPKVFFVFDQETKKAGDLENLLDQISKELKD
ncbi:MAG TPA: ribosome-binding factor A [bacterium]|nr:ribosome-binding factor A [bacterium]